MKYIVSYRVPIRFYSNPLLKIFENVKLMAPGNCFGVGKILSRSK